MAAEDSAEIVAESGDMADDLTEESLPDSVESPESSESSEESYNSYDTLWERGMFRSKMKNRRLKVFFHMTPLSQG